MVGWSLAPFAHTDGNGAEKVPGGRKIFAAASSFPRRKAQKRPRPVRAGAGYSVLLAVEGLHALFVVQDGLAHPQALGGDLQ